SRGLGLALAQALAEQSWTLIINARNGDQLEKARATLAQHTTVFAIQGDVTSADHRQALAQAIQTHGKGLDLLVNNASTLGASPLPALHDITPQTLAYIFETNVVAPLSLFQTVIPHLNDKARIINLTSDAAVEAYPTWGGYGASKAALEHLSAVLAVEQPDLSVYWVDPGDMQTQMHQDAFPGKDITDRPLPESSVPGFLALINTGDYPSGRYQAQVLAQKVGAS
ncbi:MAG: SDR family oxidoreductase, partial [Chloroflexota bacterium]